ncbi:MAG: hypothetical protein KGP28_03535 [Bdellovibrionales bacterium]|nr:hypothetical protein [Bdellovibrionales bacterium]
MNSNRLPAPRPGAPDRKIRVWSASAGGILLAIAWFSGVVSTLVALTGLILGALLFWIFRWYRKADQAARDALPDPARAEQKERIRMIRKVRYLENVGDLGERVASQAEQIPERMDHFVKMLGLKFDSGELAFQRYLSAAETTRLALLDQLQLAAAALGALGAARVGTEEDSPAIRERLELRAEQEGKIRGILEFNERALTELDRVSAAISEVRTSRGLTDVALEDVLKELAELAGRAKKYSNPESEGKSKDE